MKDFWRVGVTLPGMEQPRDLLRVCRHRGGDYLRTSSDTFVSPVPGWTVSSSRSLQSRFWTPCRALIRFPLLLSTLFLFFDDKVSGPPHSWVPDTLDVTPTSCPLPRFVLGRSPLVGLRRPDPVGTTTLLPSTDTFIPVTLFWRPPHSASAKKFLLPKKSTRSVPTGRLHLTSRLFLLSNPSRRLVLGRDTQGLRHSWSRKPYVSLPLHTGFHFQSVHPSPVSFNQEGTSVIKSWNMVTLRKFSTDLEWDLVNLLLRSRDYKKFEGVIQIISRSWPMTIPSTPEYLPKP